MPDSPVFDQAARLIREIRLDHHKSCAEELLLATLVIQMNQLNSLVQGLVAVTASKNASEPKEEATK